MTTSNDAAISSKKEVMLMAAMTIAKIQLVQVPTLMVMCMREVTKRTTATTTTRTVSMVAEEAGARDADGESRCSCCSCGRVPLCPAFALLIADGAGSRLWCCDRRLFRLHQLS